MKKYIIIVLISVFVVSCKSKAVAVQNNNTTETVAKKDNKAIEKHYENKLDFSTLYIKASAKYVDEKQSQNVTAEIRIEKDKQILISVRFLGITMAKALITPSKVSYYEKINGTYYDGDFTSLSKWLGTELDYEKVQNILLGQAVLNLKKEKYDSKIDNQLYQLSPIKENELFGILFFMNPDAAPAKLFCSRFRVTMSFYKSKGFALYACKIAW